MDAATQDRLIAAAAARGYLDLDLVRGRVTYHCRRNRSEQWGDPEEKVRAAVYSWLILEREYPPARIDLEVVVPRRTPNDWADIVVYEDDACRLPYLVVECKPRGIGAGESAQAVEQAFGNANSLRTTKFCLFDNLDESRLFEVQDHPPTERIENLLGDREALATAYGQPREFRLYAGTATDIHAAAPDEVERAVRRAHGLIWAGGRRDPLTAFDEWCKLLFAKIYDERYTPNGEPRHLQVGAREAAAAVANRVQGRYDQARAVDPSIFTDAVRLPDDKIRSVVRSIEDLSFTGTSTDSLGAAFEGFFGSIFRGELGQYFTRRELVRFVVALLDPTETEKLLDPTAGSGGFLLETLAHVWHALDDAFAGQPEQERRKLDFARNRLYGIEIHEVLGRVCQTNLYIHKDGHTNIEVGRSCLDATFTRPGLALGTFDVVVGNPPFGDAIRSDDTDQLGGSHFEDFELAVGDSVDSEILITEQAIRFLRPGGRLGFVVPDGLLNNAGEGSHCPGFRRFLLTHGRILAIVSLPDHAFRKAGAQNKTSLLFFQRFTDAERQVADETQAMMTEWALAHGLSALESQDLAAAVVTQTLPNPIFLAEADEIGYTPSGGISGRNDLYRDEGHRSVAAEGTILKEYREFVSNPDTYVGREGPACMSSSAFQLYASHPSHRLDPKYHLFERYKISDPPSGMLRYKLRDVLRSRVETVSPAGSPDEEFTTLTVHQTGRISAREAGVGKNPPAWFGAYFRDGEWRVAHAGDLIYSRIDLWKGCVGVVPSSFDGAIVTKEFPLYEVDEDLIRPHYLRLLLRTGYFQRAIRSITTGHSNRRRTNEDDFLNLEVFLPSVDVQDGIVGRVLEREQAVELSEYSYDQVVTEVEELMMGRVDINAALAALAGDRPLPPPRRPSRPIDDDAEAAG